MVNNFADNFNFNPETETAGCLNIPVPKDIDVIQAIKALKKEKNAIILAHYYQGGEIQDIADFVGDSLALAQWAAKTEADVIVLCGVHFMGETAKILSPKKRVFVPDLNAGCSLADSCPFEEFKKFKEKYPDHTVISYVNTTAAIKTLTDVVVTSTNARQIVESFPLETKIIFGPDKNLGNYINSITGRNMVLWDGACHVHEQFSLEKILELKQQYPDALVLAHPECKSVILKIANHIGSTASLLKYTTTSDKNQFIVATESGILHEMQKKNPDKTFIPAPPNGTTCACNECNFMKLNTLEKLYNCLKYEIPEIHIDEEIIKKAVKPIQKMLDISAKLGL
jgi:quinolinate synthase